MPSRNTRWSGVSENSRNMSVLSEFQSAKAQAQFILRSCIAANVTIKDSSKMRHQCGKFLLVRSSVIDLDR